ncbi:dipeptidase PepE [Hydromonas duriensis]|uniref:dipeptidase E n=1 Tax=Hydromonas duriensis TaxID=1527608 RepID=A0A4V3DK88_9BURK|nr:dipeptidase PepE [Hydromonas duriensis]TDR33090.1 dipeptidase E [Hydromonas duriensis]
MKLLLLSNSRSPDGGYLTHAHEAIAEIAGACKQAVFIPFAGVTVEWDDYLHKVQEVFSILGIDVQSAHCVSNPVALLEQAQIIVVGGGNTFNLLKHCRELGLLPVISQRVLAGVPYIGWSAGANLACPSICTTNDMPIVDPKGFDALGLIPFQLNPHYTNASPNGHQGETRDQRIAEYLAANSSQCVLGLPEGDWLRITDSAVQLNGSWPAQLFEAGKAPQTLTSPATLYLDAMRLKPFVR